MVIDNAPMAVMNKIVKIAHVLIISLPVLMADVYQHPTNAT